MAESPNTKLVTACGKAATGLARGELATNGKKHWIGGLGSQ